MSLPWRFIFIVLHCTAFSATVSAKYTWEDLQVLQQEKNYVEYLDHALDLEPSKRNASWKTVTETMGLGYIESLVAEEKVPTDSWHRIEKISDWPIFKDNEFFTKVRDKYILHTIRVCVRKIQKDCEKNALDLLSSFEHELTFPAAFLELTAPILKNQNQRFTIALPLLKNQLSEFYCKKSPVKQVVLNQISQEASAVDLIHKDCLKVLKAELEDLSLNGNSSAKRLLNANNLATANFTKLSILIDFLNNPELSSSEVDTAISNLEGLSKSPKDRKELIKDIKRLDPLPGRIFADQGKKNLSKLKLIERNFPEMIDLYARTCLEYLTGSKKFRFGNPTPECHSFFSLSEHLVTIPKSYINDYKSATHFMQK